MEWKRSDPIYPVADVTAAIEWYQRCFGFKPTVVNPPDGEPVYAVIRRDNVSIHLLRKDEAPHGLTSPVEAQFWVDEKLDELFNEVKSLGARVIETPSDRPWGHRDFIVADPDANLVWVTLPRRV
jgi:uncharacterized glyoxalase superfamily protein PhnB